MLVLFNPPTDFEVGIDEEAETQKGLFTCPVS